MAHLRSRRRLALAVPVTPSLTASLGFPPPAASAAPRAATAEQAKDAAAMAHVVNTRNEGAMTVSATGARTLRSYVAGVAALPKSTRPNARPAQVPALLKAQADNPGCPAEPHAPDGDGVADSSCKGANNRDGFHGSGVVNALRAVK
ncbi:hypothetical protein ACIHCX_04640 [Streptomyces sp. NPDC052043]|uniref:hypothetical protein n=1 Tax=Streptomyces sp. NPDC052043 TaxID=3365684 RepID=UPI0037CDC790